MINMIDSRFLDSSVWLAYFLSSGENVRQTIENEGVIYTSALSILEIQRKLLRINVGAARSDMIFEFIRKRSIIVSVTDDICYTAASLKLPAIDSLIYASAWKNNSHLFTCDNDFRAMKDVTVLSAN